MLLVRQPKRLIKDFVISVVIFTILNCFFDYRKYGDLFSNRISPSVFHGVSVALLVVLGSALSRAAIKWKIIMTLKRITPEEMDACKNILTGKRWTSLPKDEKDIVLDIIDKTAFKYSP